MGNCLAFQSQPKKETRGPLIEGGEIEFDASVTVEKMNSTSYKRYILVHRKPQIGEAYYLAPYLTQSVEPMIPCSTTDDRKLKTRKVKIVVTKEQLELLLSGTKNFQPKVEFPASGKVLGCKVAQNGYLYQVFQSCRTIKW